jgi:NAD(P)-dependent dehydrogenase (short-subunit alcohol dehydrogenase family)
MARLPNDFAAVVTGAGGGLGRALCIELGRRGGRVIVSDIAEDKAGQTADQVRSAGGEAWAMRCDVRRWEEVEALAADACKLAGTIDLVVNNAGVGVGGRIDEVSLDDWHFAIDVNLWGVVHGCRAFVPSMKARGRGWVLNVASAGGFVCLAEFGPYNVSKAGVIALSETMRSELAPHGVHTTVLCPTFFETGILDAGRGEGGETREFVRQMMTRSRLSAVDVARSAISSLERGELYALPMLDGRAAWWGKRLLPESFPKLMRIYRELMSSPRRGGPFGK